MFELLYLSLPGPLGIDQIPPCLKNSDLHLNMTGWHHPGTHKFRSWKLQQKRPFVFVFHFWNNCKIVLGSQAFSVITGKRLV